jgi:hypothetical protein
MRKVAQLLAYHQIGIVRWGDSLPLANWPYYELVY